MDDNLKLTAGMVAAFAMTFIIIPWLIPKLRERGMMGVDLNKPAKPRVAEMGGIAVVIGFFAGISVLVAIDGIEDTRIFYVSLLAILGAAFVGILDDIFNLRHRQKAFLPFLLAIPLGAALDPVITIPYMGEIDLGPFIIIAAPFAITCAANAGNMLEGFNGLGAGLGVIMAISLVALAIHHDRTDGLYVLLPLIGGLLAFLWFNRYPSRIFPGDTLMLFMGATISVGGMLSGLYAQTVLIFVPMIAEFFLKFRGKFKAENYCSDASNGHLEYHGRIESLTHILMRSGTYTERRLVLTLWIVEAVICALVIAVDVSL